jgi:predicted Zn-dependent protease
MNTEIKSYAFVQANVVNDVEAAIAYSNKNWLVKKFSKSNIKFMVGLCTLVALMVLLFFTIIPYLSEQLGKKIPKKYEIKMGEKLFDIMVDTTKQDKELTDLVNTYYRNMEIKTEYPIKITVIKDATVNAFAVLGGNIVIYTGLLQKIKRHEELAALISHEFTHINSKHTTRSICRALGGEVFLSLLLGNMGDLNKVVLGNATKFNGLNYSRKLEKEADIKGLALLQERNINNIGFIDLFTHLQLVNEDTDIAEILSSHPDMDKRKQYIKSNSNYNSGNNTTVMNQKLQAVFKTIVGDSDF